MLIRTLKPLEDSDDWVLVKDDDLVVGCIPIDVFDSGMEEDDLIYWKLINGESVRVCIMEAPDDDASR